MEIFAAMQCMFKSDVMIACTVPYDTSMMAAVSLMDLQQSSCTSCKIISTFLVVELVEGRPDLLPLETPHTTYCFIAIYMMNLSCRFTHFYAEFDVHSLLSFVVHDKIANVPVHVVTKTPVSQHSMFTE